VACIFLESFDKYGGVNSNATSVVAMLTAGEWTSGSSTSAAIVAGLSATGQALSATLSSAQPFVKSLGASYARLIGGVRFATNLVGSFNAGVSFADSGTQQCSIVATPAGTISLRNGAVGGTAIATSGSSISANSTHYLEWDITFGNSAAYQVWLDGVSLFSGTGDTTATANNTANQFVLTGAAGSAQVFTFDDLYLFDSTGSTNNAVLLTSPRIETTFPASDSAVQFVFGAGILGSSAQRVAANLSTVVNTLTLRRFTPSAACTINSISLMPSATAGSVNLRGVIYADSAGAAGTLLSSGTTVVGVTNGVAVTLPLTTPQSLSAGTPYWIGFMNDLAMTNGVATADANSLGYRANSTFASGAPGTAPAMTSGQGSFLLWGNLTGIAVNYDEVNNQPPDGQYSYVYDATVNHEDLYTFTPLSLPAPATIHSVAVKAYVQKSDSGTRTVSMRTKSGATDSGGSLTGQAMGTTFGWLGSFFPTDPNTSAVWTRTNLDAATSGLKIDS